MDFFFLLEISKNAFSYRAPPVAASVYTKTVPAYENYCPDHDYP